MIDLHRGDCLDLLKKLPDNSVDMVFADPPYGTTKIKWDKVIDFHALWVELNRVVKPNCVVAIFGVEPFSTTLRMSNFKNYKFDWIWQKSNIAGFANAKHRPLKSIENICVFSNGKPRYYPQDLKPANHPSHYTSHPSGIECITITEHHNFCIGNAIKYLWRAGLKDGNSTIQDLQKAVWYINKEIERLKK